MIFARRHGYGNAAINDAAEIFVLQFLIRKLQPTCFYYLTANLHARNSQSSMIVDFLSIDRHHLFHAIATISSFPFCDRDGFTRAVCAVKTLERNMTRTTFGLGVNRITTNQWELISPKHHQLPCYSIDRLSCCV